jgi:hypothetical protein
MVALSYVQPVTQQASEGSFAHLHWNGPIPSRHTMDDFRALGSVPQGCFRAHQKSINTMTTQLHYTGNYLTISGGPYLDCRLIS